MRLLALALTLLTTLSTASPLPSSQSTVSLRIVTASPSHLTTVANQHPLNPTTKTLRLTVGQTLSLDHAPLAAHSISIASITSGWDVSPRPRAVAEDDWRVVCKAKVGYGSGGVTFGVEDRGVELAKKGKGRGKAVEITGVECWLEGDEGLVGGF